ncbi:hypothetical protein GCM10020000_52210 [Streptomyces olivoverticillatus]
MSDLLDDDELFAPGLHAEGGAGAGGELRVDGSDGVLHVLRVDVAAVEDDDLLEPPGDVELAVVQDAEVAGAQPATVAVAQGAVEGGGALLGALPVAAGDAVAAQPDLADGAVGQLAVDGGVDDADVEVEDAAAADEGAALLPGGRLGEGVAFERGLASLAAAVGGAGRAAGDDEGGLGEPVTGVHRPGLEPGGGEAFGEGVEGVGAHGLGAVEGDAPAGEVEGGDLLVGDAAQAQVVAEVGAAARGDAVVVDGLEPADGPLDEGARRHLHGGAAQPQRVQQVGDQAHVVEVRQPAAEPVLAGGAEEAGEGGLVRQQVAVGDHHAARVGDGAGGVLEERQVVGADRRLAPGARVAEAGGVGRQADDVLVARGGQPQGDVGGAGAVGQDELGAAVADHGGGAAQLALGAVRGAFGQRGGDRDGARVEAADEGFEEAHGVGVEQQHRLPLDAVQLEAGRDPAGRGVQLTVGQVFGGQGAGRGGARGGPRRGGCGRPRRRTPRSGREQAR